MNEEQEQQPEHDVEPKLRLGTLIRRYRTEAGVELDELAKRLGVPPVTMGDVERGLATLKAEELQQLARELNVQYMPLLDAAREWNRAVFEEHGKSGVQLTDVVVTEHALRGGEELLERELIRCADDLAFVANVARELMIRAERAALRARALLAERGVPIPDVPPEQLVECSGPIHDDYEHPRPKLRLGRDFVMTLDRGAEQPKLYFCSEQCAIDHAAATGNGGEGA